MANTSSYLQYLPTVLQQGPFIGAFLTAFERVLSGPPPGASPSNLAPDGIEERLDHIQDYFDPAKTPSDFLPWLAGWSATILRDDWDADTKRQFLANIIPLYKKRGTREGLVKLLTLHSESVSVFDHDADDSPPRFTPTSPPHLFLVVAKIEKQDPAAMERKTRQIVAIIDREKPAHSFYILQLDYPHIQINDPDKTPQYPPGIFVGQNTMIGPCVPTIPSLPIQINDNPTLFPQLGPGVFVGVNTVLITP